MNYNRLKTLVLSIVPVVFIISCSGLQITAPPLPEPLPDFSEAYSITIVDNWDGLSMTAPLDGFYAIESSRDHFEGAALFTVAGNFSDEKQSTAILNIPVDTIRSFLDQLAKSHPEMGEYQPNFEHTDDYPEISIRLVYGKAQTIEFYTTSQGDENIPWEVTYNGKSYVINSGEPAQALQIIKPYLAQDILEKLIKEAGQGNP